MPVHLRPVNSFMTAGGPACSLRQTTGVIRIANENAAVHSLLLEMAFQAKGGVSGGQQAWINRAVRRMTGHATFPDGVVLEYKGTSLGGVTLEAYLVTR